MIILISMSVSAIPEFICGDGIINGNEECDPGQEGDWNCCNQETCQFIEGDCGTCCSCNIGTTEYNETQDNDCENLPIVNNCTYTPDNNPFTLDYHLAVENICVGLFTCSDHGYNEFEHTCDFNCDAICENDNNCSSYIEESEQESRFDGLKWVPETDPICYYNGSCKENCSGCDYNNMTCPDTKLENEICYYGHNCTGEGCVYGSSSTCPEFAESNGYCQFNPTCVAPGTQPRIIDEETRVLEPCQYLNEMEINETQECTGDGSVNANPPITVWIDGYTNSWTNQTSWNVTLKAEDLETWIVESAWRYNSESWTHLPIPGENPFEFNAESNLDEGEHTLEYYSIDYAGNQEVTNQIPIKIDLTS
ncbi:MAG: hypothetical protein KAH32_00410, partial [Chlamydiia bacterium]|nr:hypothetical protein [Chlamydiia bacterium]